VLILQNFGFTDSKALEGGFAEWQRLGGELVEK
jgi:rhodanese-related sulfurtransferase